MTEWTPDPTGRGVVGIEFHGWLGFTSGSDLWHRYRVLGWMTIYRRRAPLTKFSKVLRAVHDALRSDVGER